MKILEKYTMIPAVLLAIVCMLLAGFNLTAAAAPRKPLAKNIIIMIADGWGFNHVQAASYYQYGKKNRQVYNRFPVRYAMSTYMAYGDESDPCYGWGYDPEKGWTDFAYVTLCAADSAAAATAMSTGIKTYKGAIGVGLDGENLKHGLELAEEKGKSTGVVTSVQWSHATPAGFVAHNGSRQNYAEIAREMIYDSGVDVIMGCGHPWFDDDGRSKDSANTFKYVGGEDVWQDLTDHDGALGGDADGDGVPDPWVFIQERSKFQEYMLGPTPHRVLGTVQVFQTLQEKRSGDVKADPYVVPLTTTVPTLEEMTRAALNILDDDPDGFFLMIEGGAVDWAGHGNQSGRMIEEQTDFDNSVQAVVDWVTENSNWGETLLIVTGDHETGYLTGPGSNPGWEPLVNNGSGILPGMEWHSSSHTNSLIPLYAWGDASRLFRDFADQRDPVCGPYLDNTDLAEVVFKTLDP